jgi:hypothetical protein
MVIKILLAHQNRQSNVNLGRQAGLILLGFSKVFSASEMLRFDCEALPPMPGSLSTTGQRLGTTAAARRFVRYQPANGARFRQPARSVRRFEKFRHDPLSKRMIEAIRHALESAASSSLARTAEGRGCAAKFEARSGIHGWLLASSTRAISAAPESVCRNIA